MEPITASVQDTGFRSVQQDYSSLVIKAMFSDTDPEAAEVQWELLRNMTSSQRSSLLGALTTAAIAHSKRAIARANPGATQRDIDHIFIRTHYGESLADEVKAYLEARDACTSL